MTIALEMHSWPQAIVFIYSCCTQCHVFDTVWFDIVLGLTVNKCTGENAKILAAYIV